MKDDMELTLLSIEEILGEINEENKLDVLKKYGTVAAITDLAILTGNFIKDPNFRVVDDQSLKGRTGWYYTKSEDWSGNVRLVNYKGQRDFAYRYYRNGSIRPILKAPALFSKITKNRIKGFNGIEEVEFGEYPQYAADSDIQRSLEFNYNVRNLELTGKYYTFDSAKIDSFSSEFTPVVYNEYKLEGRKYIRVKANLYSGFILSNGVNYNYEDYIWIEVSPVVWLIDDKTKTLVSKRGLVSGVRFLGEDKRIDNNFSKTDMKKYIDKYMLHDLTQNVSFDKIGEKKENIGKKKSNPYKFNLGDVSEEQIIKGSIKSDIPVFLHGQSSEGKSARIKEIDPDCIILYLRNATPDSLNGKSVYDSEKGEMIDIKPSWLKKLEEKCEKEPDKLHILFFDELTNALPSIQGMAFNIILDKEVNGIWKLPKNARIVAAGNEMSDSISANQMAEPLFNRFAHVYIKTTKESWLEWASKNNIHPAIYSFVAYKKGEVLRSKYNGEKPNADPRKWEMASNMLYATGQPDMLRALIGEDITKEFIQFCNQQVITLEDIINGDYSDKEIESLNTAERYATAMSLSQVEEDNLETVRDFVTKLGKEYISIFDSMWTRGDESKLEILAELKLKDEPEMEIDNQPNLVDDTEEQIKDYYIAELKKLYDKVEDLKPKWEKYNKILKKYK